MDNKKNDGYFITRIINDLRFLIAHTDGLTLENISDDEVLLDSIMFRLVQVSENSSKLTEDFKQRYRDVPWSAIRGLRNRLVHDYGEVDLTIVYNTVKDDIPDLLSLLQGLQ